MEGDWQCNVCTVVNAAHLGTCAACGMGINTQEAVLRQRGHRRGTTSCGSGLAPGLDPACLFPSGGVSLAVMRAQLEEDLSGEASLMALTSTRTTWSHKWAFEQIRNLLVQQVRAVDMPMRFPQLHFQTGGSTLETCDVVCSNADPRDLDAVSYALKRGYR